MLNLTPRHFGILIIVSIAIGNCCSGSDLGTIQSGNVNKLLAMLSPYRNEGYYTADTPRTVAAVRESSNARPASKYKYLTKDELYNPRATDSSANVNSFDIRKLLESITSKTDTFQSRSELHISTNIRPGSNGHNGAQDLSVFDIGKILNPVKFSPYLNISEHPGERCNRVCRQGVKRTCYFEFTLEFYHAMGPACGKCAEGVEKDCNHPQCIVADGWAKGVMSINRKIPGPAIQVCKDDHVIIDVHNRADGTGAALHWHGVHMVDTPFMDGVPFVTQCPIPYANTFRYQFRATQAGTQFYHSHAGHHKANGQYGVLTIRQPDVMEPLRSWYDYDLPEHHIFIADWMHEYAEQHFPGIGSRGIYPDSVLINGRGVYTDPKIGEQTKVRPTIYYVTPGKRYRFRLVNGISHNCPFQLQIEKHNFKVIASDSFAVEPEEFDTLISNSGERYDFILEANHTKGDFWLRVRGMGFCNERPTESYALIRYSTKDKLNRENDSEIPPFPKYDEPYPYIALLNHPNTTCNPGMTNKPLSQLAAIERDEELSNATPDYKFFLGFDNYVVSNEEIFNSGEYFHFSNVAKNLTLVGAINNISLSLPDYVPLTQHELIDESKFCDSFNRPAKCADKRLCHCTHRLKVKLNSIVDLIIVDETDSVNQLSHPFHLHGNRFLVTGMGQSSNGVPMSVVEAKKREKFRVLKRSNFARNYPFKDTVSIPSRGYAIVRLKAANPGFWLMHCHYEWHLSIGMGLVLQVGELSEMVKAPSDFPKCGNYAPRIRMSDIYS